MTPEEEQILVKQIRESAEKAAEEYGGGFNSPRILEMLSFWKQHRPKMTAKYLRLGILNELAASREASYFRVRRTYHEAGLSQGDAHREAASELILEPEERPDETNSEPDEE